MADKKNQEPENIVRQIFVDPASPSVRSVVRVVTVFLVAILLASIIGYAVYALRSLIFLLIISIFFAYLVNPLVRLIRRPFKDRHLEKFMPRPLAIVIAYLLVFTVLGLAVSYLAPRLFEQAKQFAAAVPTYADTIKAKVTEINSRYENYQIPAQVQEQINEKIPQLLSDLGTKVTEVAGGLLLNIASISPWFILAPILSFFFLKDVNMFRLSLVRHFPSGRWRARAEKFLEDVNDTLAAYTRAQLVSCFLIGSVSTLAFYLLGVNYALLLGILAGVLEFIPLIGPLIVIITATSISAFSSGWQAVYVLIFLVSLRLIHDYVTYPRIVREGIHLHPLAIIVSILAGEQLAGIPGVFLAIPVVAILTVTYRNILEHRGSTNLVADWLEPEQEEANAAEPEKTVKDVETRTK